MFSECDSVAEWLVGSAARANWHPLPVRVYLRGVPRISASFPLSPEARSTTRLALVACTVLATVGVLGIVALQARRAEQTLDESASHALRDYAGYAGRMMGAEVLRRFAEQRADVLAPVSGNARRAMLAPALDEIVERGRRSFAALDVADSSIGYFRIDMRTGVASVRGRISGVLAEKVVDTLGHIVRASPGRPDPEILVIDEDGSQSVAYAQMVDPSGRTSSVYGFTYDRRVGVATIAERVFRETPLLPTSFAGARWNYDTTAFRPGEVVNDSLLAMRITDRAGNVLWRSSDAPGPASPYFVAVVVSTAAGGIVVESMLRPGSEPSLIPATVRRAQRLSLSALVVLTVLLAAVSLVALGGERSGARDRRAEAMQQLALGLRHELNNALASVMLNAELLKEEDTDDPMLRERYEAIVEQTERMRSVLRRLEKADQLDVMVPYLNEGLMVDLSAEGERRRPGHGDRRSADGET